MKIGLVHFWEITTSVTNEPTNQPTNKLAQSQYLLGEAIKIECQRVNACRRNTMIFNRCAKNERRVRSLQLYTATDHFAAVDTMDWGERGEWTRITCQFVFGQRALQRHWSVPCRPSMHRLSAVAARKFVAPSFMEYRRMVRTKWSVSGERT